jgi:hypothetical protein
MNSRIISLIALLVSVASFGYTVWLHENINSIAQAALRQREGELVRHFAPNMIEAYRGLGIPENKIPKSPQTLEELFQPTVEMITNMDNTSEESAQTNDTDWVKFAWSTNMDNLNLLQQKLQDKQINCSQLISNSDTSSFSIDSKDFTRARTISTNVISRNSLTVRINNDTNSNGYEIWKNGKKAGEEYF